MAAVLPPCLSVRLFADTAADPPGGARARGVSHGGVGGRVAPGGRDRLANHVPRPAPAAPDRPGPGQQPRPAPGHAERRGRGGPVPHPARGPMAGHRSQCRCDAPARGICRSRQRCTHSRRHQAGQRQRGPERLRDRPIRACTFAVGSRLCPLPGQRARSPGGPTRLGGRRSRCLPGRTPGASAARAGDAHPRRLATVAGAGTPTAAGPAEQRPGRGPGRRAGRHGRGRSAGPHADAGAGPERAAPAGGRRPARRPAPPACRWTSNRC